MKGKTVSANSLKSLNQRLDDNPIRKRFVAHRFFHLVNSAPLEVSHVSTFLGQWWHPLHYFPTFLARCVAVLPDVESKSAISRILNQELGGGDPSRAHEVIYGDTVEHAGFSRAVVTGSAAFQETQALVAGYERASAQRLSALGFVFATEVTDLMMVSGIGTAMERVTGVSDLEWVRIHVVQEPDHVEEATHATTRPFTQAEEDVILEHAEEMWLLWTGFFDGIEREISELTAKSARLLAATSA